MTKTSLRLAALVAMLCASQAISARPSLAQNADAVADDAQTYPDLPGRDETIAFCTGCHSFSVVAAQGMSRSRWDQTLTWMTEVHGMADIQGEPRDLILDYLAQAFPERRAPGWNNPFAR
jgi:cytochrome c5